MESKQFSARESTALERSTADVDSENRTRVLLIENDSDDARRTREAFEAISTETEIDVRANGEAALEYLEERIEDSTLAPDLVLLTLELPDLDGFELLETIRNDETLVQLPVLVLTDSEATADVNESYKRAANAFLAKPSDPDEFETIVGAIERFWFQRVSLPPHGF
ncbi:response regulator [Natronococcus occultus]|uniref:Response regulator containing a CheY-like receiver domain and a GGDEF domain n=1 Tax=Natronococcus occultus SP4 TaxID=694430 RepID=L0JWX4_9EURY|nr:response regulator [Natronococcus occultus]AGB37271.1 response regulator containing a CheY-like receiver domain and a GGDEF domain [Natronococcus occultus SP4]